MFMQSAIVTSRIAAPAAATARALRFDLLLLGLIGDRWAS